MIACLPGRDRSRLILFEAHCDTAGVDGVEAPLFPTIRDGRMYRRNIPTIILGPGSIDEAHTADEFVELDQLEHAFEVYRKIMMAFE